MTTKRHPTERQQAALAKAREALVKKHTCERCGCEDPARGLQRQSQDRIFNTVVLQKRGRKKLNVSDPLQFS